MTEQELIRAYIGINEGQGEPLSEARQRLVEVGEALEPTSMEEYGNSLRKEFYKLDIEGRFEAWCLKEGNGKLPEAVRRELFLLSL